MYKPISCVRTGAQDGRPTFPGIPSPIVKHWRCDLTALSHVYNLYFVACNEEIYAYSPSFPSQDLGDPVRIWKVPSQGLPTMPGIDIIHPHSITRVYVDYLGNTEVLLVTCDDGDVVGWRIREINRTIARMRDSPGRHDAHEVEHDFLPFEHINVGCSAWGLNVHRNARLIAISANTHRVTVLAYGLSQSDGGESEFAFPRNQSQTFTLRAQTNIPAVSFDNTGGDPSGRWLASSSIDGLTHLWDLSRPHQPARAIAVGHCVSGLDVPDLIPEACRCSDRRNVPHATWAALFVDPRSCRHVDSLTDACGVEVDTQASVSSRGFQFWDITDEGWPLGPSWAMENAPPVSAVPAAEVADENHINSSAGSEQMFIESEYEYSAMDPVGSSVTDESEQLAAQLQQEQSIEDEEEPDTELFATSSSSWEDEATLPPLSPSPGPLASHEELQSDEASDASITEDDMANTYSKKPYYDFRTSHHHKEHAAELSAYQHRPMIIVTKEEIYLLQRPLDPTSSPSFPILTMRNPLYPRLMYRRASPDPIAMYHRQCFTTQIPELGVFIIGSPAGRVGVFRLTRTQYKTEHSNEIFSFRLDHLLPMSKDKPRNVDNHKSGKRLVGVAVGPVQGMFDAEEAGKEGKGVGVRRWRLMMYHDDHTVLAFELGKYGGNEEVRVDELIV